MDLTSWVILPFLLGSVGIYGLLKLLQRLRSSAYIQDAVVVITGATSGLGKECAKVFYEAGAQVVLCGRNEEGLKDVIKQLCLIRGGAMKFHKPHMVIFDLSDVEAVASAAREILHLVGKVDILINNAGVSYRGAIVDTKLSVDRTIMDTNYFGPVALTKALLPSMIQKKGGHIVVISSVQGKISIPFRSALMDKTTAEGRTPEEVAQIVLRAVGERSKDVLVAGPLPTLAVYLRVLAPKLFFSLMAARAKKERKFKDS
ncbi:hypothetical protein GDO78_013551 [Eleutherodactylus coqui]|uniref:Dehydrogenase/reductase SDR family member 7B n=2 Tax=Eleutherodactylus coqui TaxID=57060 RepID=A0A8J6JZ40_ELECQ|nr:hypothetical protein GDO78_013551 [Eleutherodactylus coqui]